MVNPKKILLALNRREVLKLAGMSAGAMVSSSMGLWPTMASAATFIRGADVSWLQQMEATGYTFYNTSGQEEDCLSILKGYGVNAIRLRTWVNPSSDPVNGHCSQSETIAMAVRCKNSGLPVLIDFHFSDSWADPGKQYPPAAWANMTYAQMLNAMYSYVWNFMNDLNAAGVTPGWVQIGNEINPGICLPTGSMWNAPTQCVGLLNAAYKMVKQIYPSTPVLIHLANAVDLAGAESWFDRYKAYGGNWDVSAFSSYVTGSGVAGCISNMQTIQQRYGKPVMQVEFGETETDPSGTQTDLHNYIQGVEAFGGLGVFYWEPENYSPFSSYAMSAWDPSTRQPTTALNGYNGGSSGGGGGSNLIADGTYTIKNKNSGMMVDVSGASKTEGTYIDQWPANGNSNQQWQLTNLGNNYVKFVNVNSGLALDVYGASKSTGGLIDQWPYNSGENQIWQVVSSGGGYYQLINQNSGLALEVPGGSTTAGVKLDQWTPNGGANQLWYF